MSKITGLCNKKSGEMMKNGSTGKSSYAIPVPVRINPYNLRPNHCHHCKGVHLQGLITSSTVRPGLLCYFTYKLKTDYHSQFRESYTFELHVSHLIINPSQKGQSSGMHIIIIKSSYLSFQRFFEDFSRAFHHCSFPSILSVHAK